MSDLEKLLAELRSALAHLDEPLRLESHPLAQRLSAIAEAPDISRGQLLRRTLRRAIEALDPGPGVPPNAPEARPYQVLYRYAINQQSMVSIANELDISERQAYRELHLGLQSLACVLFNEELPAGEEADSIAAGIRSRAAQVRAEVERLSGTRNQEINLSQLVATVVENARPLASELKVGLRLLDQAPGLHVAANRVMLRQALLNLLSHLVRSQRSGEITVRLYNAGANAFIELTHRPASLAAPPLPEDPYAVAAQLLGALGLSWTRSEAEGGAAHISIRIPLAQERTVLIIDDNEGLIRLFESYLRGQAYRVHGVSDSSQAQVLVERLQPDVIVLDVMMPDRDGWEVLQALRTSDLGRRARIIVCSIIKDPQLALALGADAFLHKPVDRATLLRTLDQLLLTHSLASQPPTPH